MAIYICDVCDYLYDEEKEGEKSISKKLKQYEHRKKNKTILKKPKHLEYESGSDYENDSLASSCNNDSATTESKGSKNQTISTLK